jgi:hypothetical protein
VTRDACAGVKDVEGEESSEAWELDLVVRFLLLHTELDLVVSLTLSYTAFSVEVCGGPTCHMPQTCLNMYPPPHMRANMSQTCKTAPYKALRKRRSRRRRRRKKPHRVDVPASEALDGRRSIPPAFPACLAGVDPLSSAPPPPPPLLANPAKPCDSRCSSMASPLRYREMRGGEGQGGREGGWEGGRERGKGERERGKGGRARRLGFS